MSKRKSSSGYEMRHLPDFNFEKTYGLNIETSVCWVCAENKGEACYICLKPICPTCRQEHTRECYEELFLEEEDEE